MSDPRVARVTATSPRSPGIYAGEVHQEELPSPLRDNVTRPDDRESLVLRMSDFDRDARMIATSSDDYIDEPMIDHARSVVEFVRELRAREQSICLIVHCFAGLYRSGAVAEWLSADYGVRESMFSERIRYPVTDAAKSLTRGGAKTYNMTFLRLLREADAR